MTASLIASLLLRCKRRVPVAPSVPSLRSSHDGVARYFASLAMQTACASSQGGVAHCFASLALQTACAWGAVGPFASLVTCGVAHCFSLLLRCNRRVLVAPSDPFASLVTRRRCSSLRFSCVANGVCLWRRQPPRFACHMTASLIASLLLRRKRCVPVAPSVSLLRSSHDGVAHCFASLALQTACACGSIGPFASLVTRRRCSLLCLPCVAYRVCLWRRRTLRFACRMAVSLIASLLFVQSACACGAVGPFASLVT